MDAEAVVWLIFIAIWFISAVVKQLRSLVDQRPGQEPRSQAGPNTIAEAEGAAQTTGTRRQQSPRPRPPQSSRPDRQRGGRESRQEGPWRERAERSGPSDDPIRELLRQLGGGEEMLVPEQPVPTEHRPTLSEHRRTESEHRGTIGEDARVPSEHRRTESETRGTIGEDRRVASEHRMTRSEHRKGDVRVGDTAAEDLTIGEIDLPPVAETGKAGRQQRGATALARSVREDLRAPRSTAKAILLREILGPPPGLRSFGGTASGPDGSPDRPR